MDGGEKKEPEKPDKKSKIAETAEAIRTVMMAPTVLVAVVIDNTVAPLDTWQWIILIPAVGIPVNNIIKLLSKAEAVMKVIKSDSDKPD